jgi:hypothetical protein
MESGKTWVLDIVLDMHSRRYIRIYIGCVLTAGSVSHDLLLVSARTNNPNFTLLDSIV